MNFGAALSALKSGAYARRTGWNGKGMWLHIQRPDAFSKMSLPYLYMFTADKHQVPWLASQTDIMAEDWQIFYTSGSNLAPQDSADWID